MPATVLYMSMSLDGFIAGPNETDDNGLGDGGERLHEWPITGQIYDELSPPERSSPAAGDRNVVVQGAATAQRALAAGLLDEIEIRPRVGSGRHSRSLPRQAVSAS